MRSAERGRRVPARAQADPRVRRRQRRQHGGGKPARRRERQRAAARRDEARHEDRSEEHEFVLRRRARARGRVRAPVRRARARAARSSSRRCSGTAKRAGASGAVEGRKPRLSLLPGARPAAARPRRRVDRARSQRACRSYPPRDARASPTEYELGDYDVDVLTAESALADYFEPSRARTATQGGGELGDGRSAGGAEGDRASDIAQLPRAARGSRRAARHGARRRREPHARRSRSSRAWSQTGDPPAQIAEREGLAQGRATTRSSRAWIDEVIAEHPDRGGALPRRREEAAGRARRRT